MHGQLAFNPEFKEIGVYTPDNLVNGDFPQIREHVTLVAKRGVWQRGTVLGIVTEGAHKGAYTNELSATVKASAILAETTDTEEKTQQVAYLTGQFNTLALLYPKEIEVEALKTQLRASSIFIAESSRLGVSH